MFPLYAPKPQGGYVIEEAPSTEPLPAPVSPKTVSRDILNANPGDRMGAKFLNEVADGIFVTHFIATDPTGPYELKDKPIKFEKNFWG